MHTNLWSENTEEGYHMEHIDVDGILDQQAMLTLPVQTKMEILSVSVPVVKHSCVFY
jgi:hypothetical protein